MKQPDPLLDCKQIAERLNVSTRLAYELMREMRPLNVGHGKRKTLRVQPEELERWIQAHTVQPEYGRLEIVKPPKKRPKRVDYAASELTPEGKLPYRLAERRNL